MLWLESNPGDNPMNYKVQTIASLRWLQSLRAALAGMVVLVIFGCGEAGDSKPMAAEELLDRIREGTAPMILDVRSTGEFAALHIAGAINIPHFKLKDRLEELPGTGVEVVLVDQKGGRARQARTLLLDEGFTNVRMLDGHMFQWVMSKYPIE